MPTQYLTVKQSEPLFSEYLWGINEKDVRAVPVKTYNLGTTEESVTFELKELSGIKKPSVFIFFAALIKLKSFILILMPLFYVLTKNYMTGTIRDPQGLGLASLAMLFLFAGLNIRNDVHDHISGFDRVNLDSAVKPIRMGWVTAQKASRLSLVLILISGLLALPVCFLYSELAYVLAVVLFLFFLGQFAKQNSYKQQHFGELILFVLMGPALVAGYQVASGAGIDTQIIAFGALWGFAVLYLVQVNNFAHIMTSSQAKIRNSMTKMGFDRAQKFLLAAWALFIILWVVFHYFYASAAWMYAGTLLLVLASVPLFKKISYIKSPMGSGLQQVRRQAYQSFLIMVVLLICENISALLNWMSHS